MIHFVKDQLVFILFYFLNAFLLILFYFILTKGTIEVPYPIGISGFLFAVFITVKWLQYYPFHRNLPRAAANKDYALAPATCEQREAEKIISEIHQAYVERIQGIEFEKSENIRFISQWIHNMKTPVSVIDLVLQKIDSEGFKEQDAVSIKEENDRLLNLLEQVLNLIRLDDFSRDFEPLETDLAGEIKKVINQKKSQFIYHHVFPKFDEPENPVLVLTDPKWNELLLEQIISNAIKYSAGSKEAKYIYFQLGEQDGRVVLSIRDEGIGIPEYDIRRVFDPFFTGENGRKFRNSSGIGLYFCAQTAQKLGLPLTLSSAVGEGTTVTISYLSKP